MTTGPAGRPVALVTGAGRRRGIATAVVRRLAAEVLPACAPGYGDPATVLALSDEHDVPDVLMAEVRAVLGA